ncbi:MAG: hypothetical protein CBE21_10800 [Proteobacteria bacterium TMED261]|nr:MAG: hypothetical protein CBE21_10800 [Proteobacteria bacterium TMED261]
MAWAGPTYAVAILLCRHLPFALGFSSFDHYKIIWDLGSFLTLGLTEPAWPIGPYPPLIWIGVWPVCVIVNLLLTRKTRILPWRKT